MREYSKVSTTIWDSDRFTGLPTDDARLLFFYVVTAPHSNSAGCFKLSNAYACADLRWPMEKYCAARQALIDADLIEWDDTASVVMVSKWFEFNPPMNIAHRRGIEAQLRRVPSEALRDKCWQLLDAKAEEIEIKKLADADARARANVAQMPNKLSSMAIYNNGRGRA